MRFHKLLLACGLALTLAACGGTPSAELPASGNEVPASATASVASYAQFTGSLAKSDNGQPLEVNKVVPPTSETADPVPVI